MVGTWGSRRKAKADCERRNSGAPLLQETYEERKAAAVNALIDFFIDTRGCSRLIAAGHATQACENEYKAIQERLHS